MATGGFVNIYRGDGQAGIEIVMGASPTISPFIIRDTNGNIVSVIGPSGGGTIAGALGVGFQTVTTTPTDLANTSSTFVSVDATAGNIALSLPAANSTSGTPNSGRVIYIEKIDSSTNTVTISRAGADTIGSVGATSIVLTTQGACVMLVGSGTTWKLVPNTFAADSLQLKTVSSTPYTAVFSDYAVEVDATAGAFTFNLPAANAVPKGWQLKVKKIDASANAVTVTRAGADTIEGANTAALAAQWNSVNLTSDGVSLWLKF